ncbi:head-tail connector [Mycobacterium phage Weirdo19]|uniref:Head-tail connector n=1 Tax=Mycobacterium phage Weirdo19 TaxID=2601610 RepID=A0A6M2YSM7_9CAUD|nr:head-tail connector [Mycobacterium phage Weirdo19]QEA10778.1 head-tail connector [Mycobacterium phage Weirdo19]
MARPRNMKPGFHRDAKAIGRIARTDKGLKAFIHGVAEQGAERAGGHVEDYVTDRVVSAVVVGEEDQAKDGAATKAAGELGWPIR